MPNVILTPTMVTREALRILHQKLNFIGNINRQYDDSFAKEGAKIGDTLKIRLPNQYVVTTGATMVPQDTEESSVQLQVNTQKHVAMNFTSAELTLSLDDFSERIIDPAMSVMAASIEGHVLSYIYQKIWNQVNNQGAAATFKKVLDARKILVDNLAPPGLDCILNTQDNVDLVDALKGLFQDSTQIAKQYRDGKIGRTAGFDFWENTLMPSHTRGTANTAYTTSTLVGVLPISSTPVSTITLATGTGTILKGDIFTIANVFRVHPETKASTGILQQFTVTADVAGAGPATISPPIILAGAKQNVVIPTTSATAAVTVVGTSGTASGISIAFHRDFATFATADLIMPKGVDFSSRQVLDGISMRIVRQYDINNDKLPCRVDVLYGMEAIRPQLGCRIANN
jgi:P22 coat protein - gene protein 5